MKRDIAERGRDVGSVLRQYERFVKPGFHSFIEPSMMHADIIVPRAGRNHRLIKLIANNILRKLHPGRVMPTPISLLEKDPLALDAHSEDPSPDTSPTDAGSKSSKRTLEL